MPIVKRRPGSQKNHSILSHEFFIQNHADIISCFAMIFVLGLLFQPTQQLASLFVMVSHNTTDLFAQNSLLPVTYTYGIHDIPLVFYYFLIVIIIHAVIQEYGLDKLNKKLRLSKIKTSKFSESGQLLFFYLVSIFWGIAIFREQNFYVNIPSLWKDYPFRDITYLKKFFFIIQISYWLHNFPELYFQKTKKEERKARIVYSLLYFTVIITCYLLNFTNVCLYLLIPHYFIEALFHFSRLFYFAEKCFISNYSFLVWAVLYVLIRLYSMILIVLTFWIGLAETEISEFDWTTGNFNTKQVRTFCLIGAVFIEIWMMWNFINFQLKRLKEELELEEQLKKTKISENNVQVEQKEKKSNKKKVN